MQYMIDENTGGVIWLPETQQSQDPWQDYWNSFGYGSGLPVGYAQLPGFAERMGINPADAISAIDPSRAMLGSLFSGATDTNNQNLLAGLAMYQMANNAGKLTPDVQNEINTFVDQGNAAKDAYNAQQSANAKSALGTFGGLLAAVTLPGVMGMYPGQGGMSIFGADAAPAVGESVSGGWSAGGSPLTFDPMAIGSEWAMPAIDIATGQAPSYLSALNAATSGGGILSGLLNGFGFKDAAGAIGSLLGSRENAALGAALGGLLGGMNGSKQAGTTTVTNDPWAGQQPYLLDLFQRSAALNAANSSSPVYGASQDEMMKTLQGGYYNSNPYLDAAYDRAAGKVGAAVDSRFARSNRYGSGAHQGVLGDTLSSLANDMYGGNYQQERQRQYGAMMGGPAFGQQMTNAPWSNLRNYSDIVRGNYGGSVSSPYYTNPYAGVLGGALAGSQLLGRF